MIQSFVKTSSLILIVFDNGDIMQFSLKDKEFNALYECGTLEDMFKIIKENRYFYLEEIKNSNVLEIKGDHVILKGVSELSIPIDLALKIVKAEKEKNEKLLKTYINFWTLLSLNTDSLCRENLYKFLKKWGMTISDSGFFLCYRNVCTTEEIDVFTDERTHTFKIKIGEIVTMPREDCDCDSMRSCSRGLHCGGRDWLSKGYFGDTPLACLVNPADVVAVPMEDEEYGKLRTCAYLPIGKVDFDDEGKIIPLYKEDGFASSYVSKVIYEGILGTEEDSAYKLSFQNIPNINRQSVSDKILDIARQCIVDRKINIINEEGKQED